MDETAAWLKSLDEEEKQTTPAADETALWLKSLDEAESAPAQPAAESSFDADMPAWMRNIEREEPPVVESPIPVQEVEESQESGVPSWLSDLDKEETVIASSNADDLPSWLRDETGEVVAEPVKIEPTRPTDWKPADTKQPEIEYSPPPVEPKQPEIIYSPPLEETQQPEPEKPLPAVSFEQPMEEVVALSEESPAETQPPEPKPEPRPTRKIPAKPAPAPEHYNEPVTRSRGPGMPMMPGIDPILGAGRSELSRSNIPGALEAYGKLIKKGRFLDEVIYDLREALYRYPVEVSIWQSLGDAYMRANRLQDALDAYTKAEELLR
jgi:tetratricopeptide (TPR) repeat protein